MTTNTIQLQADDGCVYIYNIDTDKLPRDIAKKLQRFQNKIAKHEGKGLE